MEERRVRAAGLDLRVSVPPCVYPPGEDSELAIEALSMLRRLGVRADSVVDIGTGTGVLALAAWELWGPSIVAATDISPFAVRAARENLRGVPALVARCYLASCLAGVWDVVVANPPYLPVVDRLEGECGRYEALSWGWPGMVEGFCLESARLAGRGVVMVYSSLSGFDADRCLEERGFAVIGRLEQRFFMERLMAIAAVRRG